MKNKTEKKIETFEDFKKQLEKARRKNARKQTVYTIIDSAIFGMTLGAAAMATGIGFGIDISLISNRK